MPQHRQPVPGLTLQFSFSHAGLPIRRPGCHQPLSVLEDRQRALAGAALMRADLTGAKLTGAILADAALVGARWPRDTPVPQGWKRDADSGRLEKAAGD